jgi:hypothetical protein
MKSKAILKNKNVINSQRVRGSYHQKSSIVDQSDISLVYAELAEEGHEDFYNYLDWLGLLKTPDLLILTSSHHYYFEVEDLKNVKTVVNLNKLNNIKSIKDFLHAIYCVLPHKCYFIGSFTDNKKQNGFLSSRNSLNRIEGQGSNSEFEEGPWNSLLNMLYGVIDSKTNRYMSEKTVRLLLENTSLKILDITEFNGLTYFCTQKDKPSVE